MICVSIANIGYKHCCELVKNESFSEIRIDKLNFTEEQFRDIFRNSNKTLATCRDEGLSLDERLKLMHLAIDSGTDIIDIEIEAPEEYRLPLVKHAREKGVDIIISYHNFKSTPDEFELVSIMDQCFNFGADIAKIVTTINNNLDRVNVLSLYKGLKENIVAFGMGEMGKLTRALSVVLGAPYTYAVPDGLDAVAPGQISKSQLQSQIDYLKKI